MFVVVAEMFLTVWFALILGGAFLGLAGWLKPGTVHSSAESFLRIGAGVSGQLGLHKMIN